MPVEVIGVRFLPSARVWVVINRAGETLKQCTTREDALAYAGQQLSMPADEAREWAKTVA